jgi:hypothetical protein
LIFAALAGSVAPSAWSPAYAQVGIELGARGPRVYDDRRYDNRYERRGRRVIEEDDDDDCRMVVRRYTNRFGERVVRRERVCDQVRPSRKFASIAAGDNCDPQVDRK